MKIKTCGARVPCQENILLKFIQYLKSNKAPCLIYADLKSLKNV